MPNGGPDRIVGLDRDVIGRIEALILEAVHQHRDAAVVFRACNSAGLVLAGDQPALAIAGVAVGIVGGLAVHADSPGRLIPAHDAVVGNVAPEHTSGISEIDRAFAPAHARGQPLNAGIEQAIAVEARVEALDGGVGIALAGLPRAERARCGGHRERADTPSQHVASRDMHGNCPIPPRPGLAVCREANPIDGALPQPATGIAASSRFPHRLPTRDDVPWHGKTLGELH
jgi:hypothetical protein